MPNKGKTLDQTLKSFNDLLAEVFKDPDKILYHYIKEFQTREPPRRHLIRAVCACGWTSYWYGHEKWSILVTNFQRLHVEPNKTSGISSHNWARIENPRDPSEMIVTCTCGWNSPVFDTFQRCIEYWNKHMKLVNDAK